LGDGVGVGVMIGWGLGLRVTEITKLFKIKSR
jgi:hypothetical protein